MSTDNENWRDSNKESRGASRDGNKSFNKEGFGRRDDSRPSFNRDGKFNREGHFSREGGDRPSRPSFNRGGSDRPSFNRPSRPYNKEGGDRPSFNREGGDRPRPSFNREGGDRPRPSFNREGGDRPRPSFNREGGDRPRPSFNREGGDRPRPSFNREGGDRPRPSFNREGGDRPRPSFNREGGDRPRPSFNREGGDRPRPSFNREGGDRPRPSFNREGGDRPRPSFNREGGDRPRPSFNREGGDRPRPSFNREDKPWRRNEGQEGGEGDRPRFRRPTSNYGGPSIPREGEEGRSRRPRFSSNDSRSQEFSRPVRRRSDDYDPNAKYSEKKRIEYKEQFADPNEPIRLNKYLANAGVCSRREADEFITAGVVSVNGEIIIELGTKVKRTDVVKFHEETVSLESKVYVLLNKPKDCVTTSDDPQARLTVMDLVKGACQERIYPVGRLDRNTTGVLLLTNDGDLASKLTHPQFLKKKIYHVFLDKNVTNHDMEQIASGVQLEDGEIHADAISYATETDKDQVGIEIHSGKNRIVRRLFESLGYKVIKLDRVFFAGLTKKSLRRGEWRYLTEQEVNMLRMGAFE
ncbi:pseudouridine synthase [uncultured Bacteroides sp.]|uniref:pseudouridine synthase n=1 Tax=uncultured Bacteroides sp. TaxID=162156 RepID=UPI002AA955A4|nr:pseudouridine synthase [uncultured Bacteroides sp.]